MLQKIKELMQIKELIDEINRKVGEHSKQVNSLKEERVILNKELNEIKGNQTEFLTIGNNFNFRIYKNNSKVIS